MAGSDYASVAGMTERMSTMDLTDFLLARIAEDEAVARRATGADRTGNWWLDPDEGGVTDVSCLDVQGFITAIDVDAAHVALHDPARVLAECEAKRRIVEQWEMTQPPASGADYAVDQELEIVMFHLATIYVDHPDYREEWRA